MAFEKICIDGLGILRISEFEKYGVNAFFTTRRYIDSNNFNLSYKWANSKEEIDKNYFILFKNLSIDYRNIYYAKQVHKNDIIVVEKGFNFFEYKQENEADGLITQKSGITLMTFHADCIPVYIFDKEKRIISLIHSGWRGSLQHISKRAIDILILQFKSNVSNLIVAIGPSICKEHFEVGKEVYDAFLQEFGSDICIHHEVKFYVDLKKAIEKDLLEAGLKKEQIIVSDMCTYEKEDLFFSYRRDFKTPEKLGSMVAPHEDGEIMKNILIVDDEPHIVELIKFNLQKEGYNTFEAENGNTALDIIKNNKIDLVILDIMMSDKDGYEVLKEIRFNKGTRNLPVILLSAKSEEIDRILGLELGADDYITKPFSVKELVARVKALFRRIENLKPEVEEKIRFGDIEVDFTKRSVKKRNQEISLSFKEFELLKLLIENRGRVLDRDFILQRVWGYEFDGDSRTVDVHIRFLRRKLEDDEKNPKYIETVRGVGYRFREGSD